MNENDDYAGGFTDGFVAGHGKALQHVQELISEYYDLERRCDTERAMLLKRLELAVKTMKIKEQPHEK